MDGLFGFMLEKLALDTAGSDLWEPLPDPLFDYSRRLTFREWWRVKVHGKEDPRWLWRYPNVRIVLVDDGDWLPHYEAHPQ